MAGLFGLSVNSATESSFFTETLYWGTSYNGHLGEECCGLAVSDSYVIKSDSKPGLFPPNFKDRMQQFKGLNGIGYCGHAPEPFFVKKSKLGPFSICFSGNVNNIIKLIDIFDREGHLFERGDDIEIMAKLIARADDFFSGLEKMNEAVEGAWVILILTEQELYAARSPSGHWPLVLGKHKDKLATCVCSEQTGFNNLGFGIIREIEPGEIVFINRGAISLTRKLKEARKRFCSFYGVYTSSPAAVVHGLPATWIRKELGACLAKRDIEKGFIPHIVMPVPDSGRGHAEGYFREFCIQMMKGKIPRMPFHEEQLIKYGFSRSFLRPSKQERDKTALYKIITTAETIDHLLKVLKRESLDFIADDIVKSKRIIIVVCEDSVVRGTQVRSNLAPKIRTIYEKNGIKAEIHIRASYPELLSHCQNDKTTKKGEPLASRVPDIKERAKELGVESIDYNTIEDLVRVLEADKDNLCLECALNPA